jgi:uncharacterized membrane protein
MLAKFFILTILSLLFTGCIKDVKPWEKGTLAHERMQIGGNPMLKKINEHIYSSKEGSVGGGGIGGGGCGCN